MYWQPEDPTDDPEVELKKDPCINGDGTYSPNCPGWHSYSNADNPNLVCPAYLHCTEAQMMDYLYRFAFPGQNPNDPVSNGDVNLVWLGILPLGHIETGVNGLMITNVTQGDHLMYDGQVVREAIKNSDGSWSIVTTGTGNNVQIPISTYDSNLSPFEPQFPSSSETAQFTFASLNQLLGLGAFNDLDRAMLNYIVENH